MFYFKDNETKQLLKESTKQLYNTGLTQYYKTLSILLKEDKDEYDWTGLKDRCSWVLSSIFDNFDSIYTMVDDELFTNNFKNITITKQDNKLNLVIDGSEVTGNSKYFIVTLISVSYMLMLSLKSLPNYEKVGGLLLYHTAKTLSADLYKKSFLSSYGLNGDILKVILDSVNENNSVIGILVTLLGLLLISNSFDKVYRSTILLLVSTIKSPVDKSIGFINAFVIKSSELLELDLTLVSKDLVSQLKIARGA